VSQAFDFLSLIEDASKNSNVACCYLNNEISFLMLLLVKNNNEE